MRPLVIIESPYAGDVLINVEYARKACRDSFLKGEMPFASHLFYPQFLFDNVEEERIAGIAAGYFLWRLAKLIAFYTDRGWSPGMEEALKHARSLGDNVEFRSVYGEVVMPPE